MTSLPLLRAGLAVAVVAPIALASDTLSIASMALNRWLLARGKGRTAVREIGIHGGPPTRVVGAVVVAAFVFGTVVVVGETLLS